MEEASTKTNTATTISDTSNTNRGNVNGDQDVNFMNTM